jgi:hypothetical protein
MGRKKHEHVKRFTCKIQGFAYTPKVNKTSKVQVDSELVTKKRAKDKLDFIEKEKIFNSIKEFFPDIKSQSCIEDIHNSRELFKLQKNIPFIMDAINAICTHGKEYIKNINSGAKYYEATIPINKFAFFAIGEHNEYKKDLVKEAERLTQVSLFNYKKYSSEIVILLDKKSCIMCIPFIISMIKFEFNEKYIENKKASEITISFYKGIWGNVVNNKKGANFLFTPFALSARMRATIKKYPELDINSHKNYRRLLLFLLKHDYLNHNYIEFDPIEMAYCCNDRLLRSYNDGKFRRKEAIEFVKKGIELFKKMESEDYLDGLKIQNENNFIILNNKKFKIMLKERINKQFKSNQRRLPFDK